MDDDNKAENENNKKDMGNLNYNEVAIEDTADVGAYSIIKQDNTINIETYKEEVIISSTESEIDYLQENLVPNYPSIGLKKIIHHLKLPKVFKIKKDIFYCSDIQRLLPGNWLNDKIINFYFELLSETFTDTYFFNTFAYPRIQSSFEFIELKEIYKDIDFSKYKYFIFPIHSTAHWSLVKIQSSYVFGFDSLGKISRDVTDNLIDFYTNVILTGSEQDIIIKNIPIYDLIPKQENGDDCGVFCCAYAKYYSTSNELHYTNNVFYPFDTRDIPKIRKQMIHEILAGKIMYF